MHDRNTIQGIEKPCERISEIGIVERCFRRIYTIKLGFYGIAVGTFRISGIKNIFWLITPCGAIFVHDFYHRRISVQIRINPIINASECAIGGVSGLCYGSVRKLYCLQTLSFADKRNCIVVMLVRWFNLGSVDCVSQKMMIKLIIARHINLMKEMLVTKPYFFSSISVGLFAMNDDIIVRLDIYFPYMGYDYAPAVQCLI